MAGLQRVGYGCGFPKGFLQVRVKGEANKGIGSILIYLITILSAHNIHITKVVSSLSNELPSFKDSPLPVT